SNPGPNASLWSLDPSRIAHCLEIPGETHVAKIRGVGFDQKVPETRRKRQTLWSKPPETIRNKGQICEFHRKQHETERQPSRNASQVTTANADQVHSMSDCVLMIASSSGKVWKALALRPDGTVCTITTPSGDRPSRLPVLQWKT